MAQVYIIIAIAVLIVIVAVLFFMRKNKKQAPISRLASLAFVFILVGIVFGNSGWLGYTLIGVGVILAIVDAAAKLKKKS